MSARISVATGFTALGMVAGVAALALWAPERLIAPQDLRGWLLMLGALTALASLGIILANLIGAPAPRKARAGVQALRPLVLPEVAQTAAVAEDDAAMARLEAMVGLAPVKQEIRSLIARAKVDAMRRDQGQQVAAVSQHMVFTGPPGVGKTEVARIMGAVFRQMKLLRKGHVVETDRAGLVGAYIGRTAIRTLEKCREALDGILFIDEAYALAGEGNDFGSEAIDTILKFMEDNRDRIVVIVAGYSDEMDRFIEMNPGLAGRFSRYIAFPAYEAGDLAEILARMAQAQGFTLPATTPALLAPWLGERMPRKDWSNGREMRSLLERMREAQALRISAQDAPDLNVLTEQDLTAALSVRRV